MSSPRDLGAALASVAGTSPDSYRAYETQPAPQPAPRRSFVSLEALANKRGITGLNFCTQCGTELKPHWHGSSRTSSGVCQRCGSPAGGVSINSLDEVPRLDGQQRASYRNTKSELTAPERATPARGAPLPQRDAASPGLRSLRPGGPRTQRARASRLVGLGCHAGERHPRVGGGHPRGRRAIARQEERRLSEHAGLPVQAVDWASLRSRRTLRTWRTPTADRAERTCPTMSWTM